MGVASPTVFLPDAAAEPRSRRRRPPSSQADRERRKQFGAKYGGITRQIKLDRERSTD